MAVTSVTLLFTGQSGSIEGGKVSYTSIYAVDVDSALDGPQVAVAGCGVSLGDKYQFGNDSDRLAKCKSLRPDRVADTRLRFTITATFDNDQGGGDGNKNQDQKPDTNGNYTDDPFQWRPEISISPVTVQVPVEFATLRTELTELGFGLGKVGNLGPVMNSAGTVIDPPITKDHRQKLLRVTKYFTKYPSEFDEFEEKVNSDNFVVNLPGLIRAYKPFCVLFEPFQATWKLQTKKDGTLIDYWEADLSFLIDEVRTHRVTITDRGIHKLVAPGDDNGRGGTYSAGDFPGGVAPVVRMLDPEGMPITEPVLFNGKGKPAPPGRVPFFITYSVYGEVSFAGIRL